MQFTINNIEVNLTSKESKVFATSLDIAEVFGKKHKDVLRIINNMGERVRRNFTPMSYKDSYGRSQCAYEMTRDGFSFLVMGFTGERADNWKLDFIEAFNKMEQIIQTPQHQIPQTYYVIND
jgi:Rha family phage regulatory protein